MCETRLSGAFSRHTVSPMIYSERSEERAAVYQPYGTAIIHVSTHPAYTRHVAAVTSPPRTEGERAAEPH